MSIRTRNILIVVATLIVAFGVGAAWQFAQANRARADLATIEAQLEGVRFELALEQLHSTLALATVAAQLGNYERARQLTSDFFTALQEHSASAPDAAQATFADMLGARDAVITTLSRAEPEAGLDLARMLGRYREALGRETGGLPSGAAPMPGDTVG